MLGFPAFLEAGDALKIQKSPEKYGQWDAFSRKAGEIPDFSLQKRAQVIQCFYLCGLPVRFLYKKDGKP